MAAALQYNILSRPGESELVIKKSRFLGRLKLVRSETEAYDFINIQRKRYYDARHHCFAMRIGDPKNVFERFSDDSEPSGTAGRPILGILKGSGLYDVCAVVSRYFGGTLLGTGGLVKAYSEATKGAIKASKIAALNRGLRLDIVTDFSDGQRIRVSAYKMGINLLAEEYSSYLKLSFLVPESLVSAFNDKIRDASKGKAKPTVRGWVLYYNDPKAVIYKEN